MEIRGIVTTTVLILALIAISTTSASADTCWVAKPAWDVPDVGYESVPAFADLDGDGDYDLLIGECDGESYGYENTGNASSPDWTTNADWDAPDVGDYAGPAFADLDCDGDYDLLIGECDDESYGYENTGNASSPDWTTNADWDAPDVGDYAKPAFADLDGDGDYDLLIGAEDGESYGYENICPCPCADTTPPDPVNLANMTGGGYPDYWVNYTWSAGTGNVTDSYNVTLNGTWTNGTAATFMNVSMSPCEWANITVLAYNASCTGTPSEGSVSDEVQAPCDATPPVITITTPVPYGLYTVGMTLNFSATDDESGVDTIVGNLTNASGVSQNVSSGFAPPVGAYTLVVTATDNASNTNVSDPVFFVVYDPEGGFAMGAGWFYPDGDSTLPDGIANFLFIARYKYGSSTGMLSFLYMDAGIYLKSTSIDWLTISAVSAQFQGTGTINGEGLYTFRVKAKDNGEPGAGTDHFDIKIWNGTDTEADPYHKAKNTISGWDIVVYKK